MWKNKRKKRILAAWGKPKPKKKTLFYEELLFDFQEPPEALDEETIADIDFALLFNHLDRTTSTVGGQYLYAKLRSGAQSKEELAQLEADLRYYENHNKDDLILALAKLQHQDDYLYPYVMYAELPSRSVNLRWIQALQLFTFALILFGILHPFLWVLLIPVMALNLFIHYRHKNKISFFVNIFSGLAKLHTVGKVILAKAKLNETDQQKLKKDLKRLQGLTNRTTLLNTDKLKNTEITGAAWYVSELIKFVTLMDVVVFNNLIGKVEEIRPAIVHIYERIGAADMALSVLAWRRDLPYYTTPVFHEETAVELAGLYHPLLENAVANDITLREQNLLLTGSNMSGKSTFIKTMIINAICAQVLHTAFAEKYVSRFWKIATSIDISDDLEAGMSYYLQEVQRIGQLVTYAGKSQQPYLFAIDEVFKGTNTVERVSAAKAILEYLGTKDCLVLVSTHDIELAELLTSNYELYHFQESVREQDLSFDYKLKPGVLTESNAVKLLRITGYPAAILEEAERLSARLAKQQT